MYDINTHLSSLMMAQGAQIAYFAAMADPELKFSDSTIDKIII